MEDEQIVDLFWARDEAAIGAAAEKYGPYCRTITQAILVDEADSDECLNDTWLGGLGGYGCQYLGMDGDGAALILMDHDFAPQERFKADTPPLHIDLTLRDFGRSLHTDHGEVLTPGEWRFTFQLDRSHIPTPVTLPDTVAEGRWGGGDERIITVTFTELELTSTGLRFRADTGGRTVNYSDMLWAVLKNGSRIHTGSGMGTATEDGCMIHAYHWPVPLDLAQVAAIQLGDALVPVPQP